MAIVASTSQSTIDKLLAAWPVSSLESMSITQYANLDDHNSFCYLLEYGSRDLGEIGGIPLTKFGLWKYKNRKDYDERFKSDTLYAWNGKFGENRTQAFNEIRSTIKEIAEAATLGDWERVESIDFFSVAKWKIAFVYSENRLVPIYTREGLLQIAAGLGKRFPENARIVDLQMFIVEKRPTTTPMVEYAWHLWDHYVKGKPFRNYFIIGTKYKDESGHDSKDVFPDMLANNSVAIDFLYNYDLSHLVGASDEIINQYVAENAGEEIDLGRVQGYFRILLNLKPGDIIALKSHGAFGKLKIIAYAVVTAREGKIYEYKPDELGHHINVEFVEVGVERQTTLNYAGTIHKIDPNKHEHLLKIFGPFLHVDSVAVSDEEEDSALHQKSEESYVRGPIAERIVRQLHNIIQNSLYLDLKKNFPLQQVTMEYEGRVDILRESDTERWLYEIKPFENVLQCLRNAIGQLIEYSFRFPATDKKTTLVIVGPAELEGDAVAALSHFEESINIPIEYYRHAPRTRQEVKQKQSKKYVSTS